MYNTKPDTYHSYMPALDGLRGMAILWVIVWHYFGFVHPFFPGWAGVDLFFVLSGYLITERLTDTKKSPDYFSRFYRNRALRILPLYYLVVVPFLLSIHFVREANRPSLLFYIDHWKSFFLFTQNWTFCISGRPTDLSLLPLWSLAVEEQFYLFWPVVILLATGKKNSWKNFAALIVFIMLVRTACYLFSPSYGDSNYYNTFFRMDSLVVGSLLYLLHRNSIKIPATVFKWIFWGLLTVTLAASFFIGNVLPYNPFFATAGYTTTALLFASLVHQAVQPGKSPITRFFNFGFLRFFGKISYGLYIFHFLVLQLAGTRLYYFGIARWPRHGDIIHWITVAICLLFSLLLSMLSYRYFESYFLRMKKMPDSQ